MRPFAVFFAVLLSSGFVRPDYPPPSEEGHEYYGADGGASQSRSAGGMSFVGDWSDKDWQVLSTYNRPKCLDIPSNLTLCRNIGYDQMRLPNLLEHDTLREATQQASSWVRLTHVGCHPDTQVFLCSLFAPVCLDQPIAPCRSLCEAVKAGCENRMLQYGFPWPDMLRCDRFPSGTDLCIGIRSQQDTEDDNEAVCPSCILPTDKSPADILDILCQADFVIRAKVEQSLVTGNDLKIVTAKKKKILRSATKKKAAKELLRAGVFFLDGAAGCDCPALDTVNGRRSDDHVIIAGNRTGDQRLVGSFVQSARSKAVRSVLRDLRAKDACSKRGGGGIPGGKQEEKGEKKKEKKNEGRSRSQEVGGEQGEEEESKNQKVRNKGTKVTGKTSGEDRSNDRDNRKKDNNGGGDNRKGNRNDNAKGNRATTESQTTSTQSPRAAGRQKNERNQRVGVMTSARPTKKGRTPQKATSLALH